MSMDNRLTAIDRRLLGIYGGGLLMAILASGFWWIQTENQLANAQQPDRVALVKPIRIVQTVYAPREAVIEKVLVKTGQRVKAGDVLFELLSHTLVQERAEREMELKRAQLRVSALGEERERLAFLVERAVIPQSEFKKARAEFEEAQLELTAQQGQWETLQRKMSELEVKAAVSGTVFDANIAGRLLTKPVERGEVLLKLTASPPGEPRD